MLRLDESVLTRERVELQTWYFDSLRPKLIRAACSGVVERGAADELDRQVCELFNLPEVHAEVEP